MKSPAAHHGNSFSHCKMSNIPDPARLCKPGVLSVAVWSDPIVSRLRLAVQSVSRLRSLDTLKSYRFLPRLNLDFAFQPTERALCVAAGWASRIELGRYRRLKFAIGGAAMGTSTSERCSRRAFQNEPLIP